MCQPLGSEPGFTSPRVLGERFVNPQTLSFFSPRWRLTLILITADYWRAVLRTSSLFGSVSPLKGLDEYTTPLRLGKVSRPLKKTKADFELNSIKE